LPDEKFNKKPNCAKKRPEKGQTDCLIGQKKSQTLFAVLTFLCHKEAFKLQEYQKMSSKLG